ncbi:hypothetical protein [Nocardia sp. NPDC052566]|uniref:hypothetical protein n=1 Tax=Nocardia sp. NPDC052566 TaxID=3364330 RepID=UPI0037C55F95
MSTSSPNAGIAQGPNAFRGLTPPSTTSSNSGWRARFEAKLSGHMRGFDTMTEPVWRVRARDALGSAIEGDPGAAASKVAEMLRDDGPETIVRASLLWIDTLFAVTPPPTVLKNLVATPAMAPEQMWALQLIAARANGNKDAGQALFVSALSLGSDHVLNCLASLLTVIAMKLGGRA